MVKADPPSPIQGCNIELGTRLKQDWLLRLLLEIGPLRSIPAVISHVVSERQQKYHASEPFRTSLPNSLHSINEQLQSAMKAVAVRNPAVSQDTGFGLRWSEDESLLGPTHFSTRATQASSHIWLTHKMIPEQDAGLFQELLRLSKDSLHYTTRHKRTSLYRPAGNAVYPRHTLGWRCASPSLRRPGITH